MKEFDYCPQGHIREYIIGGLLYTNYYYCEKCNKIFTPTIVELSEKDINENYTDNRYDALVHKAKIQKALNKVTLTDLHNLGYM